MTYNAIAAAAQDQHLRSRIGEIDEPGKDESVITDAMLLAAVQPLVPPAPVPTI